MGPRNMGCKKQGAKAASSLFEYLIIKLGYSIIHGWWHLFGSVVASMAVSFDFHSTNIVQLSSLNRFRCHHALITKLSNNDLFAPCFLQPIFWTFFSGSQTDPCFQNKDSGCRLTGQVFKRFHLNSWTCLDILFNPLYWSLYWFEIEQPWS